MTVDFLTRHWSLVIASVLFTAIALFVLFRIYTDSTRGQLGARVRDLQTRYRDVDKASKALRRAEKRVSRLSKNSANVKPRLVQEAQEAVEDAQSLLKIAGDQVLIAENHVRKVIVEEYPPKRQAAMRAHYLRSDTEQGAPFSF